MTFHVDWESGHGGDCLYEIRKELIKNLDANSEYDKSFLAV